MSVTLNDTSRTADYVSAEGITWDTTGSADDVARWLGNASQADRVTILRCARNASTDGRALLITFPSVITFILGYAGKGRFGLYVPSDHPTDHEHTVSGECERCGVWVEAKQAGPPDDNQDEVDAAIAAHETGPVYWGEEHRD